MSGSVQTATAPLSPILQERRDSTTNSAQKKRPYQLNNNNNNHQKNTWAKNNNKNDPQSQAVDVQQQKKRQKIQLPNKFFLGGNITDPLNLNSLLGGSDVDTPTSSDTTKATGNKNENDSSSNSSSSKTNEDKKIQITSQAKLPNRNEIVNLILRPNIKDPLNLDGTYDANRNGNLLVKRTRKHRRSLCKDGDIPIPSTTTAPMPTTIPKPQNSNFKRKRAHSFSVHSTSTSHTSNSLFNRSKSTLQDDIKHNFSSTSGSSSSSNNSNCDDEVPFKQTKRMLSESALSGLIESQNCSKNSVVEMEDVMQKSLVDDTSPQKRKQSVASTSNQQNFSKNGFKFRFGNYNRYYGYRLGGQDESDHRLDQLKAEWFKDKSVLDIGCNVGNVTLHIAKTFEPKKIVGIDIDPQLIFSARKNIRNYIDKLEGEQKQYPMSFKLNYGALMTQTTSLFPNNVYFTQTNYVPATDDLLNSTKPEYDFILALSLTKWIHLNWGDDGLKRFFKKIYLNLHAGGCLLLEPQSWVSYKKKAKLTKETADNYKNIKFRPNEFTKYLLSTDVGFSSCKTLATPFNKSKGFRRSILLFTKLEASNVKNPLSIDKIEESIESQEQQQQQQL